MDIYDEIYRSVAKRMKAQIDNPQLTSSLKSVGDDAGLKNYDPNIALLTVLIPDAIAYAITKFVDTSSINQPTHSDLK